MLTYVDVFLWIIFPYITLTVFVVGHVYRYQTDQFNWQAKSSEIFEKKLLRWGSPLFHYGVIFVFFGHVAGVVIPKAVWESIGVTDHMYHFGAVWVGGLMGVITLIGILILLYRRFSVKRVYKNNTIWDGLVFLLLLFVIIVGFTNTVGYTATGGTFDYREAIGPWFRGLFVFRPRPELMVDAPPGFQIHVLTAFLLFAIWPFSRLVHLWSYPFKYLNRGYVLFRNLHQ